MRQLGHTEGQDFIVDSVVYNADKPDEAAREMVRHRFLARNGPSAAV
jgi:hypothetical protein